MLACQTVLTSPQGWAALLRGGIIGRIAKEFLSINGALDGSSVEVTAHRVGYIAPSGNDDTRFCDDHLTDNEIAIICGTYSLYTGEFYLLCCFFLKKILQRQVKLLCGRGFPCKQLGKHFAVDAIG